MIDFAAPKAWRFDDVVQRFDADDTLRYALALGLGANPTDPHQLRFASEDAVRAPLVLPTFAVVLGYPGSWMQNPATGIDFTKVAHSEEGVVGTHPPIPARLPGDGCNVFVCSVPKAGEVRAVAVGGSQRSALLPEVPTVAESGLSGYESYSWAGFVVPAGTPREMVERLSADIDAALADPAVMQRRYEAGAEAMPTSLQCFGQMLHAEIQKWGRVVRTEQIQPG